MSFRKDNSITLETARSIGQFLYGYEQVAMLVLPNICSLKTDYFDKPNSQFLIEEMGGGKSQFINLIHASNPRNVLKLPSKFYAWEAVKEFKSSDFHNKLVVHDDMIICLSGLTRKSKEQLIGFITELFGSHRYVQLGKKIEARCNALFGIARQNFLKNQQDLINTTVFDRLTMVRPPIKSEEETNQVLRKMLIEREGMKPPKVPLPLGKKKPMKIKLDWDKVDFELVNSYANGLKRQIGMSPTRGANYVCNFLKGNAYLNGRKEVKMSDLMLFGDVFPLHFAKKSNYLRVYEALRDNSDMTDEEIIKRANISRRTFYRYKSGFSKYDFVTD
jgi:hypothetical protein